MQKKPEPKVIFAPDYWTKVTNQSSTATLTEGVYRFFANHKYAVEETALAGGCRSLFIGALRDFVAYNSRSHLKNHILNQKDIERIVHDIYGDSMMALSVLSPSNRPDSVDSVNVVCVPISSTISCSNELVRWLARSIPDDFVYVPKKQEEGSSDSRHPDASGGCCSGGLPEGEGLSFSAITEGG